MPQLPGHPSPFFKSSAPIARKFGGDPEGGVTRAESLVVAPDPRGRGVRRLLSVGRRAVEATRYPVREKKGG